MPALKFLSGYPAALLKQALPVLERGEVPDLMARRHGAAHAIGNDAALYEHVMRLKQRFMRNAGPIARVAYDAKLQPVQQALGLHTRVSRVQGTRLQARREIRVASVFKQAPAPFLQMIVVHELAHLKHAAHDKAFYALCCHMEPQYHALEFDLRLWLCAREFAAVRPLPDTASQRAVAACA
jgi:predicted metal-dependent hydrolase